MEEEPETEEEGPEREEEEPETEEVEPETAGQTNADFMLFSDADNKHA